MIPSHTAPSLLGIHTRFSLHPIIAKELKDNSVNVAFPDIKDPFNYRGGISEGLI